MRWLSECTVTQLQMVARSIGSSSGGKKAILRSHLMDELQHDHFALPDKTSSSEPSEHRIVSIDMGIRNLAMCTVVVAKDWQTKKKPALPRVQHWARKAISNKAATESSVEEALRATVKEAFDPKTYAQHAYDLVSNFILPEQPTQVLIERQRFRSMGGSAVQEWTLRVNMFEAMIYAALRTFSEQKIWNGLVHAVAPAKVSKFWIGDNDVGSEDPLRSKSTKTKQAKVALVGEWLSTGQQCRLEGEAADVGQAYLAKLARKTTKTKMDREITAGTDRSCPDIGKLDDLADCLLQAMAWIRWEENRRALISEERSIIETLVTSDKKAGRRRKPK